MRAWPCLGFPGRAWPPLVVPGLLIGFPGSAWPSPGLPIGRISAHPICNQKSNGIEIIGALYNAFDIYVCLGVLPFHLSTGALVLPCPSGKSPAAGWMPEACPPGFPMKNPPPPARLLHGGSIASWAKIIVGVDAGVILKKKMKPESRERYKKHEF